MKLKNIQAMISAICLCACIAFTGCSERVNTPNEMPSGDQSIESGEVSVDDMSSESSGDSSSESESSKPQTSSNEEYLEIRLDHEYLETVEKDELFVWIHLRVDGEALRAEFENKYPEFIGNDNLYYYYWPRYLKAHNEPIIMGFLRDYNIDYETVIFYKLTANISGYFDKSVVSSMLDDSRVGSITYFPGGDPLSGLHH